MKKIDPPKPVIFSCPNIPLEFKIGGTFVTSNPFALWGLETYGNPSIPVGSTVTIEPKKGDQPVKIIQGAVYDSVFGKTLTCYGNFITGNTEYQVKIDSQVAYKNCVYDYKSFKCTQPK